MTLTTINLAALGDTINLTTEVTGTLPIANGGTNSTATTFVNAATNVTGTLPVTKGGTGLASGTTDQFLKFTGSTAIGSSAVSAGKLNQIITNNRRGEYNISGNHGSGFVTMANPYITITPSAASSKIKLTFQVLLSADGTGYKATDLDMRRAISGGATTQRLAYTLDNSSIQGMGHRSFSGRNDGSANNTPYVIYTLVWVDSPSTTSAIEYKLVAQATDNAANGNLYIFNNGLTCMFIGEEILA